MSKLKLKIQALFSLLFAKGYILMCSPNPLDEEVDVEYFYRGFDREQMVLICDSFAEDVEEYLQAEEDELMANRVGEGMKNFINQIHLN